MRSLLAVVLDICPQDALKVPTPEDEDVIVTWSTLFFASDVGLIRIAMATSPDGLSWDRRGTVLEPEGEGPDGLSVHTPCVVRLHDGSVGMWYTGIPIETRSSATASASRGSPGPGSPDVTAERFPMADPGRLLRLADDMARRAAEDEGFAALAVLAAHAVLESLVNQLGREEIQSFNERARFLPKWHDLCERTIGRQLDAAPDLERLHALRDGVAGFSGPPERLDRRSPTPPPEVPEMLSVETARWAVDAVRRVVEEFHQRAGHERPDWLDWGGMRRPVILFDNDCGFCRWSLSKLLAWDRHGRLRPVALQSEQADDLLMGMDRERKMASWHLVAPDGRTYSGGEAVPQLARLLPAGAPIAALASAFPRATDRAYRWVARHRERLGRVLGERACAVDPAERDR